MITNILVPTDFSSVADNALLFALKFAQKCNAAVHVLHVDAVPVTDAYFPANAYPSVMIEMQAASKRNFDRLKEIHSDFKYKEAIVMGFVYDEIRKYAEEKKIDLVVMGTTGSSGISEVLIGSNTASVVSRLAIPVLVIPALASYHDLKKIVYATDYSEPEFPAVSRLVELAELYDAKIEVFHVRSESDSYFNGEHNFFIKNKHQRPYQDWKMIQSDDPDLTGSINRFAEKEHADLLVVAKHNRGFFDRLFHRSFSKHMVFHANIPLLVLNK